MSYFLGIITGLIISILILAIELYLRPRGQGLPALRRKLEQVTKPTGAIIFPKSFQEQKSEKIVKSNDLQGKDTTLEELLNL